MFQGLKKIAMPNVLTKELPYYCRISIKKGLDTETEKAQLDIYMDKAKSRICNLARQLFIVAKKFKENENT